MGNVIGNGKVLIAVLALAVAGTGWVGAANGADKAAGEGQTPAAHAPGLSASHGLSPGEENGDDTSNCPDRIVDCKPPRMPWYVRSEAVALRRDANHDVGFAALNGEVALSSVYLDYPFQLGPRVLIGRTINDCYQIEGSYFNVAQSDDTVTVRDSQWRLLSAFTNYLPPFTPETEFRRNVTDNSLMSIRGLSYLQSGELNLRQAISMPPGRMAASFLVGARYMAIREGFEYLSLSKAVPADGPVLDPGGNIDHYVYPALGPTASFARVDTGNELLGCQLGAMIEFFKEDGWWVNFEVKGAIFNNHATLDTTFSQVDVTTAAQHDFPTSHTARNTTAFMGDLALTVVYRWGPRASARFGYQAMWIDRVALAADNFNTDMSLLTQGPQLHTNANVVYHGPFAGLELAW